MMYDELTIVDTKFCCFVLSCEERPQGCKTMEISGVSCEKEKKCMSKNEKGINKVSAPSGVRNLIISHGLTCEGMS